MLVENLESMADHASTHTNEIIPAMAGAAASAVLSGGRLVAGWLNAMFAQGPAPMPADNTLPWLGIVAAGVGLGWSIYQGGRNRAKEVIEQAYGVLNQLHEEQAEKLERCTREKDAALTRIALLERELTLMKAGSQIDARPATPGNSVPRALPGTASPDL